MESWKFYVCLILGGLLIDDVTSQTGTTQGVQGLYNCNRISMTCEGANSTCDATSGVCSCESGLEGFDCSVNTSQVVSGPCNCLNGGSCVDRGAGVECVCTDAFYGMRCENIKVMPTCYPDAINVTIVPYSNPANPFSGLIYVLGNDTPNCSVNDVGNGVYQKRIMYDSCGGATATNDTSGDTIRSFTLVVQYDPTFVTDYDQKFVFECTIKKSDSNVTWETTDLSSNQGQPSLPEQKVTGQLRPVDLSVVTAADNAPITTPQAIGTLLKLNFKFNGGQVYDSFRIEQITAHNGLTGANAQSFDFVRGGCVTPEAGNLANGKGIVKDFSGDPTSQISLQFKLFKLRFSSQLAFRNIVKVCKGTGGCNTTVCTPNEFPKLGRRRRALDEDQLDEAGDDDDDDDDADSKFEEIDNKGVVVWIPGEKNVNIPDDMNEYFDNLKNRQSNNDGGITSCFGNLWFILCIAALTLVLVLGGVLVAVVINNRKTNNKMETINAYDNKGYGTKF